MSTRIVFALIALAMGPASAAAEPLTFTRVRPNVLVVRDSSYASNMTVVRTSGGLVVVDGFMYRNSTREALDRVADSLGERRIALAINTHGHDDHTWGNQILRERGAPILAHDSTTAYVRARIGQMEEFRRRAPVAVKAAEDSLAAGDSLSDATRTRLRNRIARIGGNFNAHQDLVVTPPTVSFSRDTTITVGRTRFLLRVIGSAHSKGDVAVLVPSERIIAVGDLALTDELIRADPRENDLAHWIASLDRLAQDARERKIDRLIPGHGSVGTLGALARTRDHLKTLRVD